MLDSPIHSDLGLTPLDCFERCQADRWLYGISQTQWIQQVQEGCVALETWKIQLSGLPRVMVLSRDPLVVLTAFMACAIAHVPIFLGNPDWQLSELQQAQSLARPHLLWQDEGLKLIETANFDPEQAGWIMIPTGGTSGQIKFAIHTWQTLAIAVDGMQQFFGEWAESIHSCCVLPLHHVSGLMQFLRSLMTGGSLRVIPFRTFLCGDSTDDFLAPQSLLPQSYFLSFVPTQLSRFIEQNPTERINWLKTFQCILLGGAPASTSLLNHAAQLGLNLAPTYGMTETAAQVMTLHPQDFLAGVQPPGEVLPHVRLSLLEREPMVGVMQWSGDSLFYGYFPEFNPSRRYQTDDIAQRLPDGSLRLIGRESRKIISGGENIYPEEIEAVLMAMNDIEDVWIWGEADDDWGEIAIAAYVPALDIQPQELVARLKTQLASYKCPKHWLRLEAIPRNAQGKVNVSQVQQAWLQQIA